MNFCTISMHRDYKNRILADHTWACIASDIEIEGVLRVWLCNCSRHPLMPTDAQIIFSSLPSGVPKGTWLLNCLAHYKMIKNALPPDPAEAMVLNPTCGSSSPVVPHIKFRGYAP